MVFNKTLSNKRSSNANLSSKFENTKGVIRSRKLKKDKQYNGNIKKDKGTNNGGVVFNGPLFFLLPFPPFTIVFSVLLRLTTSDNLLDV
jgi:hypothetical protein